MRIARSRLFATSLLIGISLLLPACEEEVKAQKAEGCGTGQSQIRVGDGFFQTMCGCNEGEGNRAVGSETFLCSASAPRTVIFHFSNATLTHRIRSTGSGALYFPSSPLYAPLQERPISAHAVMLEVPGDYTFQDDFQPTLRGVIRLH